MLYDVSTLHFETDAGDGFREPGFSMERRLDPQITLGLLTDATGFPLNVAAFEGNKAETATMVPVINAFKTAHNLTDVTVVADAGMISEANQVALQGAGLSYILGARIPYLPDVVREWRDKHPDEAIPDALVLTQPWPSTGSEKSRGIPTESSTTSTPRPGPKNAAWHRRAGRKGPARCRWARAGQTQPLHPAHGGNEVGEPSLGGQDPRAGRMEGLHHQPRWPPRDVRHRRV